MKIRGAGWCPYTRTVAWVILATLVFLPFLASGAWWGMDEWPEKFPSVVEELDRKAWRASAHTLFPSRYETFHHNINILRQLFLKEKDDWWPINDTRAFEQSYSQLVQEGWLLLQAAQQKRTVQEQEVKALIAHEGTQLARLRSLVSLFDLQNDVHALSRAHGLLEVAARRLDFGQLVEARAVALEAIQQLQGVETHTMSQMTRYADEAQLAQWQRWVQDTIKWTTTHHAMAVLVVKASRQLQVYRNGKVFASYPVELGFNGLEDKFYEGDGATPEGQFHIIKKKSKGETRFYKALLLDYPTAEQTRRFQEGKAEGRIPTHQSIGGLIEIHGKADDTQELTRGCVGLDNGAMDRLFEVAKSGMPVTIVGAVQSENQIVRIIQEIQVHLADRKRVRPLGKEIS